MKIIFRILVIIIAAAACSTVLSQYQIIQVSNQNLPNEVSIVINPKNPNQVVMGSNISTGLDSSLTGYYYSTNGGYNWTGGILHSYLATPSGDPVLIVDTTGKFFFLQNSNCMKVPRYDRLLMLKSADGGMTWPTGSTFGKNGNKFQDKPWGCVDRSHSAYGNCIYSVWTEFSVYHSSNPLDSSIILFTKSTDGGSNWISPVRISRRKGDSRDSCNTVSGAVPCTGPNGELYVTWSGPVGIGSGQYGVFFNKSTDGGSTWLDSERVAAVQYYGWVIVLPGVRVTNGLPNICCDNSNGPNRGAIYINYSDQRNGLNDNDVWLIKSTNGGSNWSQPKKVNSDTAGNQQFLNWMTIDPVTGYIYVIFYDQRNATPVTADIYVARSTDGGESFWNIKITNSPFGIYNIPLGDYINISAYNGKVRPAWVGSVNMSNVIYTAIMDTVYPFIEHSHIKSSTDTSQRTAVGCVNLYSGSGTGYNSPRLYYKKGNNSYSYVYPVSVTQNCYVFSIPGSPPGTRVSYYIAAQDSAGTSVITYPPGGGGINPPGTIPPASVITYDVYPVHEQCSSTVPRQIYDNQTVVDSMQISTSGYINKVTVRINVTHQNDGDLILQLMNGGNNVNLSLRNGEGGQNYNNTVFDDNATVPITQGSPPYSGSYKPQSPLSILRDLPVAGSWKLRLIDGATGNTGTLNGWCVNFEIKNSIDIEINETPVKFLLLQNYPNPFNSSTRISYSIPKDGDVSLKIYDMLGREVRTLVSGRQKAGDYIAMFSSGDMPSGVYFYRLISGDFSEIKKMVILK